MVDFGLLKKTFSYHAIHAPVSKFSTPNAAQSYFQKELMIGAKWGRKPAILVLKPE